MPGAAVQTSPQLLTLAGPLALTSFESDRLAARLRAIDPAVTGAEASYLYLLVVEGPCDQARLAELLDLNETTPPQPHLLIAPRLGTQSPWSSKATDILHNTGFANIQRIERARAVHLSGSSDLKKLAPALHDRMTESVFFNTDDLHQLFGEHQSKSLATIDILALGAEAIRQADRTLGLSLAPDEIDYLVREFRNLNRNPTDVELYMFAQANSEHCRHKIFNATWTIHDPAINNGTTNTPSSQPEHGDLTPSPTLSSRPERAARSGETCSSGTSKQPTDASEESEKPLSLFQMIRNTYAANSENVLSAYRDNAAVIRGGPGSRYFPDPITQIYTAHPEQIDILLKVETHNHPTAISPWPGAATGSGGEIRDEGATGRGAKPKAGLCGFTVSNLHLPQAPQPWERPPSRPAHIASPLDIMIEGPLGAAAYNNEFGRPNLCGYFRTYEQEVNGTTFGYHKPIMLAGGLGNIRAAHIEKRPIRPGDLLIVLGGPAMLIGLGGGAASSQSGNQSNADLDFASVQRDNAEMERRAQEVIDRCWQLDSLDPNGSQPSTIDENQNSAFDENQNSVFDENQNSVFDESQNSVISTGARSAERRDPQFATAGRDKNLGGRNPILSLHDVGAGGLSNAFPELVKDGGVGGLFDLAAIPQAEAGLSPLEVWCNEAQERYVLALAPEDLPAFEKICERERCPFAVAGRATAELQIILEDSADPNHQPKPIDLPQQLLFGKPPKMQRSFTRTQTQPQPLDLAHINLGEAIERLLRLPAIASKSFLITIGDRSVGGLVVQDQMVGPWQVPVADCAVTLRSFDSACNPGPAPGEAMAIGERTPLAVTNAPASARMAVGEVLTNLAGAAIEKLSDIKLSANWMAAAGEPGQDEALYNAVQALGLELCPALGLTIPVGKDSMSMKTTWRESEATSSLSSRPAHENAQRVEGEAERSLYSARAPFALSSRPERAARSGEIRSSETAIEHTVLSPLSVVISGFAPVTDVRRTLTPQLQPGDTTLILIDLGEGKDRLGHSALAQVYNQPGGETPDTPAPAKLLAFFNTLQQLNREEKLLAYHDRSDGGLFVTLAEMAFAGHLGLDINLEASTDPLAQLFSEELGAVLQVRTDQAPEVLEQLTTAGLHTKTIARTTTNHQIAIRNHGELLHSTTRTSLHKLWSDNSFHIASLRDNPHSAAQEFSLLDDENRPGLFIQTSFNPEERIEAPFLNKTRPRVAILREQGVNGQSEMAFAFDRAGFESVDVTMSDLLANRFSLNDFTGLAACGGFSYGDVLGAGSGWAKTILFNNFLSEQFANFFARPDTFTLGACNGCQMLAQLKDLIPGALHWPRFVRNLSARFEARLAMVEVQPTNSIFFKDMAGSRMPIIVAHGEGHATHLAPSNSIVLRYIDTYGRPTEHYPLNPSGSPGGTAALTSTDGRAFIVMPHPERIFLGAQHTWTRNLKESPWQRLFSNARRWVG